MPQVWPICGSSPTDDVLLHALPIFHTHGLFVASNISLLTGGRMIFLPGFDLEAVLRLLPQATAMMGVPTFYTRLLDDPGFTRDLAAQRAAVRVRLGAPAGRNAPRRSKPAPATAFWNAMA